MTLRSILFTAAFLTAMPTVQASPFQTFDDYFDLNDASRASSLTEGQTLSVGQSLYSPSGAYRLTVQGDGNIVLYTSTNTPVWSTFFGRVGTIATASYGVRPATQLTLQTDGNLVAYNNGVATWHTETYGYNGNSNLQVQDDGNMVIYTTPRATWASNQGSFVRWDTQIQGCYRLPNDANQGVCIRGNKLTAMYLPPGSPVYYRCGATAGGVTIYQNAIESKLYVWNPPQGGIITSDPNVNTLLCEPMQINNPIIVAPAFSNVQLPVPFVSTLAQATNGNASSTFSGLWTSKAGQMLRVTSIPGL